MEREANYLAVGSFVLLVLVMGVLFVYWYSEGNEHRNFKRYEIYFDGSVSGLTQGGPVRYLGVDVGRVERIQVDPRSANRVLVLADIDANVPISDLTVAQLSLQGITGVMYIDLRERNAQDTARRLLANVPGEKYPVIPSVHSDLDLFLGSLPELAERLEDLVNRASGIFSPGNVDAIGRIAGHLDQATAGLPQSVRSLQQLLDSAHSTVDDARGLIDSLHATSQSASVDLLATVQKLRTTSDNLASASARLDSFVERNGEQITGFVRTGVPQVEGLLRDSRAAMEQVAELARTLRDNPSRLFYQPRATGVTIPP